jgi:hypothetical protein
MLNRDLIFSDKPIHRVKRHLLFWFFWWLYFGFVHALNPMLNMPGNPQMAFFRNLPFCIVESLLMLIPQTLLAYPLIYFYLSRQIFPGIFVDGAVPVYLCCFQYVYGTAGQSKDHCIPFAGATL